MEFFDSIGKQVILGAKIKGGGAGVVYCDSSSPKYAIKIFHDLFIQKETKLASRLKILYQLSQTVDLTIKTGSSINCLGSFPKDLVLNKSKQVVGYRMDRIQNGFDLSEITECRDISKAFYSIKKQNLNLYNQLINRFFYDTQNTIYNRFVLCRNLVLAFSKLYPPISNKGLEMDLKILNFDIKPSNILVHLVPIAGKFAIVPFILDIDNLTLENKSKKLSPVSTQITTEYRAPEGPLDEYYDYFSIAVILYQLIFDTHPFTVRGGTRFSDGDTRDYYIKNRCFAWGKNRKFLTSETKNDWRHNNFNFISPQLQTLFIRAFDSEIRANRPAPSEWSAELKAFIMVNNGKLNTLFKSA